MADFDTRWNTVCAQAVKTFHDLARQSARGTIDTTAAFLAVKATAEKFADDLLALLKSDARMSSGDEEEDRFNANVATVRRLEEKAFRARHHARRVEAVIQKAQR